jgi:hypothetical protein
MGKEQVRFIRKQLMDGNLFDTQQYITFCEVFGKYDSCLRVFLVGIATARAGLYQHADIGEVHTQPFALRRSEGYAAVGRYFALPDQTYGKHQSFFVAASYTKSQIKRAICLSAPGATFAFRRRLLSI